MRGFLSWMLTYRRGSGDLLTEAAQTMNAQTALLKKAAAAIDEWQQLALTSQRSSRDLAIAFRIFCETPEVDIRDELDALVQELSDAIAQLEEHVPGEVI